MKCHIIHEINNYIVGTYIPYAFDATENFLYARYRAQEQMTLSSVCQDLKTSDGVVVISDGIVVLHLFRLPCFSHDPRSKVMNEMPLVHTTFKLTRLDSDQGKDRKKEATFSIT